MSKHFALLSLLSIALIGAIGCGGHVNHAPTPSEEEAMRAHDEAVQESEMAHMLEMQKAEKEARKKK
ncbi:hypothetical protein LOC68_16540 [Blastopirellula sp. JC732]|uniref:Uncharacterized protein n=1 Tax=Blastopirellula sediminis TaxID=2894196 RepID=A0A9X1MPE8_9BACT|nr:hypothetical protein [Blastopirellula sediminis]MCC9606701.1 hypothetical protein [Blastopirellula sediminis]MCC9630002.1 hypothetical protein [Blastopirellula sediminis]